MNVIFLKVGIFWGNDAAAKIASDVDVKREAKNSKGGEAIQKITIKHFWRECDFLKVGIFWGNDAAAKITSDVDVKRETKNSKGGEAIFQVQTLYYQRGRNKFILSEAKKIPFSNQNH